MTELTDPVSHGLWRPSLAFGVCGIFLIGQSVAAWAQPPSESTPHFEVVSAKKATPAEMRMSLVDGGPGSRDPGQLTYRGVSLEYFLLAAYGKKRYQISAPPWLPESGVTIIAKVPAGATREQVSLMMQNVLIDRFHLALGHETRVVTGYELSTVKADAKVAATGQAKAEVESALNELGLTKVAMREKRLPSGVTRLGARGVSLSQFFSFTVESQLGGPISDVTGLNGKYDFILDYVRARSANLPPVADELGQDLTSALVSQLGLKVTPKGIPMDVLVIKQIDKEPSDN